jgi:hypothetical protein
LAEGLFFVQLDLVGQDELRLLDVLGSQELLGAGAAGSGLAVVVPLNLGRHGVSLRSLASISLAVPHVPACLALLAQTACVGLPLAKVYIPSPSTNAEYETAFGAAIAEAVADGVDCMALGDLYLHRPQAALAELCGSDLHCGVYRRSDAR